MKTIPLTRGQATLVDDNDFDWLNQWKWYAWKSSSGKYYAVHTVNHNPKSKAVLRLHRLLMAPFPGQEVDHIDGNPLNNQRANLRICTHSQNSRNRGAGCNNTTGFKGVCKASDGFGFVSHIGINGEKMYLGYFTNPQDAAFAYDKAAREHYGEFAKMNT